ncbi:ATP-binding protein [Streptomyces sp. NBC_00648]|uniref:ATP-binding protein n=1 Tax=Streptomyces sp. NBC_00648 TaxID=2975797 RepID=UPI0032495513
MSAPGEPTPANPITQPAEAKQLFPRYPRSAGQARAALRQQLAEWAITGESADIAELLLSELVTNAIAHGQASPGREIGVRFALCDGRLRMEVSDAHDALPKPRPAGDDDENGRGLTLVAALADNWGSCPRRGGIGKTVWAELKLPTGPQQEDRQQ